MREAKYINQFAFSDFANQQHVWIDDIRRDDVQRLQTMFKNLTDDHGMYVGERKGGATFIVKIRGKLILTSNDDPECLIADIPGLRRRFDFIHVSNLGVRKQLFQ